MANEIFQKKLGARIKMARVEAGLSQIELAEKLSCSSPTINNYEKGYRQPSIEALIKIAEITECSVNYLISDIDYDEIFSNPRTKYISKTAAIEILNGISRDEYRSDEFRQNIKEMIHCIRRNDWGKSKTKLQAK